MSKLLFAEITHERDIVKAVLDWLNVQHGTRAWRRNVGGVEAEYEGKKRFVKFGEKGQSDIWGITTGGRHFEIECKVPGNEPTLAQDEWLTLCAGLQAFCFVACSLDDFIQEWRKAGL